MSANSIDYLDGLNPQQRDAVATQEGPILILAGAGSGKCVLPDTHIAVNGELLSAQQIWEHYHGNETFDGEGYLSTPIKPLWVDSFDVETGIFIRKPVQAIYRQQVSEPIRIITLTDGSSISLTKSHRLFNGLRWGNALEIGQTVAVPRSLPHGDQFFDPKLAEFLGWWIGEGYDRRDKRRPGAVNYQMTLKSREEIEYLRDLVDFLERRYASRVSQKRITYRGEKNTFSFSFCNRDFTGLLISHGFVPDRRSAQKEIPPGLMNANEEAICAFLRAYADAEGHVHVQRHSVEIPTASPKLARQVAYLLRRFGVWANVKQVIKYAANTRDKTRRVYYRLLISGPSLRMFATEIGFSLQRKSDALRLIVNTKSNPNTDLIPSAEILARLHGDTSIGKKRLAGSIDYSYCLDKNLSRETYFQKIRPAMQILAGQVGVQFNGNQNTPTFILTSSQAAFIHEAQSKLDTLAHQDLCYPRIKEIRDAHYQGWVYDLMVADTHNFVAENILCHNTRVITYRIARLIAAHNARPENILAVTFTNKAAGEMKARVDKLLADYYGERQPSASPLISTFHSLCVRILRRDIEKLGRGYKRSFTIYDADDQQRLLRGCIRDCGYEDKQLTPRQTQSAISAAKNRSENPNFYAERADQMGDPRRQAIARVYALYEQRLEASNALDFDDLLIRTVQLLRNSEESRRYYHNRFRHVMVDEFQDTNGIQYSLARLVVEGDHATLHSRKPDDFWADRSFCVVGDESQSIYAFRGSDFNIILNFERDFPGTKVIKLEDNYRSTRRILAAANKVIANNTQRFDKVLRATAAEGENIRYAQLLDGETEARWVAGKIEEHLRREPGIRAAVLYRTNAQSRLFEEACRRAGLRYNLVGGFSFYERAEVKDIIAYLKLAMNPNDSIALMRVINTPPRGIGKTTIDDIERRARDFGVSHWETINIIVEQNLLPARAVSALRAFRDIANKLAERARDAAEPISEIVKAAVISTGYERTLKDEDTEEAEGRLLNLEELVNAAAESEQRGETLRDFLDHAALVSDTDEYKAEAQVTLMTMHAAKGLEFPLVLIAGLEEGLFPHSRANESQNDLEEERRLCYVAITRAEKYLYLTHAMKRRVYGTEMPSEPSRFLMEFPIELIEDQSKGASWLRFASKASAFESRESAPSSPAPPKRAGNYQGRTYNSADSVKEFFARQGRKVDASDFETRAGSDDESSPGAATTGLKVGTRVRHAKYGVGLIVKREGEDENAKLTINFPGYGHKKMIEKYAALEKA